MNGVSIIIPAYNGGRTIRECLHAVTNLDWPGEREIIVVDDGSTDDTPEIVASFPNVVLLRVVHGGAARATNTGIKMSHHDILLLVDADAILERDWLVKVMSVFEDSTISAVSGYIVTANSSVIGKLV